ncbi:MAG: DNA-formamidopyrimidine glycosylase family protein [Nocardioides sp.]
MPEGDTVWRTARLLDRALTGQVLTGCDFRVPKLATVDLTGSAIRRTVSRGKHLLTYIDEWTLHTHLKMDGAWHVYTPGQRWRRREYQARTVLQTGRHLAVGFSLGVVELIPSMEEAAIVGHLGPDLLGPDWDEAEALRRLRADPARAVRDALLDQRVLAGIGNMYVAELCFLHGTHPRTPVAQVANPVRLLRRAYQVLQLNKDRAIQCTTGDLRNGMRMWVYRRDTQPCRRCRTPILIAMLGDKGQERAAYWCPHCQPEELPRGG